MSGAWAHAVLGCMLLAGTARAQSVALVAGLPGTAPTGPLSLLASAKTAPGIMAENTAPVVRIPAVPAAVAVRGPLARIKDVASIEGIRDNQLVGYGLVVGFRAQATRSRPHFPPRRWLPCCCAWA